MQRELDKPGYEVGYGKPPKGTRFKKGQSGNPKGRPPREKILERLLDQELAEKVPIAENGRHRSVSKIDVIYRRLVNGAVQGDTKALHDVLRMMEVLDRYYEKVGTKDPPLARQPAAVVLLRHNGRDDLDLLQDAELNRRLARTEREWYAEQQRKGNPANDNDDTVSELKTAS